MHTIGEIIFWKCLVLAAWESFHEARKAKLHEAAWKALVARFNYEWSRRRAQQPLLLADLRAKGFQ